MYLICEKKMAFLQLPANLPFLSNLMKDPGVFGISYNSS